MIRLLFVRALMGLITVSPPPIFLQENSDDYLLIKVQYKQIPSYDEEPRFDAYVTIRIDDMLKMNMNKNDMNPRPCIIYCLTKNGGVYTCESQSKDYTYTCHKYKDVNKLYYSIRFDSAEIKNSNFFDETLESITSAKKGFKLRISNSNSKRKEIYKITCWKINASFDVCSLFMTRPTQPIYTYEGAYIKFISLAGDLTKKQKVRIKKILRAIVATSRNDHW